MTSAPSSPSICVAKGPGRRRLKSTTLTPERAGEFGFSLGFIWFDFGSECLCDCHREEPAATWRSRESPRLLRYGVPRNDPYREPLRCPAPLRRRYARDEPAWR